MARLNKVHAIIPLGYEAFASH
jgi:hypothetical protein